MTESKRHMKPLQEIIDEIEGLEELMKSPIFDVEEKEKIEERLKMLYKKKEDYERGEDDWRIKGSGTQGVRWVIVQIFPPIP